MPECSPRMLYFRHMLVTTNSLIRLIDESIYKSNIIKCLYTVIKCAYLHINFLYLRLKYINSMGTEEFFMMDLNGGWGEKLALGNVRNTLYYGGYIF